MLFPSGNPFKRHGEVLYLQPLIPPKRFDIFSPLTGGCSEGLGAFWFFLKRHPAKLVLKTLKHFKIFHFSNTTIESQADRAAHRNAQLHLPQVAAPQVDALWFGEPVMGPIRYALGKWPLKFKRDEMGIAALFCAGNDNAVPDGPDRTEALDKLEFIVDLVVDVDTVAVIVENRSGKNMPYVVLAMNDGSHLCSCRTLLTLGLCCRHLWMAMRLSCKFGFHIWIPNQHWLVEQGRRPMTDWPATVTPKWAMARNHAATVEEDAIREAPVDPIGGQAGRWQAITDTTTFESSLVDLKENGATPQDRQFLYVDYIKRTTAAALGVGVETIEPDHLLNHLVTSFLAQVERAASVGSGAGIAVGNPDVVRLPASSRSTGRRQVGSYERFLEEGSRAHAQTGDG